MLTSIVLSLFSLLTFASAACDASSALSLEQFVAVLTDATSTPSTPSTGCTGGSSCAIFPDCPDCEIDITGELCQMWHSNQLQNGVNSNLLNGAGSFGVFSRRASTLECGATEVCVNAAAAGVLMCIDPATLDFQDSNGGSGNFNSDTYTMANGQATSIASGVTGLPTPTGSGSGNTAATGTAGGGGGTAAGTVTGTAAAATNTASNVVAASDNGATSDSRMGGLLSMAMVAAGVAGALL